MVREALGWFQLADYDRAKHQAELDILSRYTRGNVLTQNGSVLDDPELRELSRAGDEAIESIEKSLAHAA